jgi:hypothetical protein
VGIGIHVVKIVQNTRWYKLNAMVRECKPEIEKVTGLKFKGDVNVKSVTPAEMRDADKDTGKSASEWVVIRNYFARKGESASSEDKDPIGLLRLKDRTILIRDDVVTDNELRLVLSHEMTHLLQDTNFDPARWRGEAAKRLDCRHARRAIGEGMADYVNACLLAQRNSKSIDHYCDMYLRIDMERTSTRVYADGLRFFKQFIDSRGWKNIGDLFNPDSPCTYEQILHPEKFLESPDYPKDIQFSASLIDNLKTRQIIADNTLGESYIADILSNYLDEEKRAEAAAGWDGDHLLLLKNPTNDIKSLVWCTTWDTRKDAEEFYSAMALVSHHRFSYVTVTETRLPFDSGDDKYLFLSNQGTVSCYIGIKGKDVLIMEDFSSSELATILPAAWQYEKHGQSDAYDSQE